MSNIKIAKSEILPLETKHYSTEVLVDVIVDSKVYKFLISVSGYAPNASEREKERGWKLDWGMDHTESEAHLLIAQKIAKVLNS